MKIGLYYQIAILENGKVVRKTRRRICHSMIVGYVGLLLIQRGNTARHIKKIDGTSPSVDPYYTNFSIKAGAGALTTGIVVGTGDTAVDADDYVMETIIAHGIGAGQLEYGVANIAGGQFIAPQYSGSSGHFSANRQFANNSGGTITVKEIGMYAVMGCIARDVLVSAQDVADGQAMVVTYEFKVTI